MRKLISKGHSTAEYLLATSLVIILGGILLWGTDSKDLLKNFVSSTTHGKLAGDKLAVNALGAAVLPAAAANLPPLQAGQEQMCFYGSDVCLTVPVVNAQESETVGGLGGGTTKRLAAVLMQLPQILQELGVDPPVVDLVTRLANKGHDMGEQLSTVETLCPSGQTCQGANAEQVKANVDDLKINDLTELQAYWQSLNDYLAAHPDALRAFPEARALIEQKVIEIREIIAGLKAEKRVQEFQVNDVVNRTVSSTRANPTGDLKKIISYAKGNYRRSDDFNVTALERYLGFASRYSSSGRTRFSGTPTQIKAQATRTLNNIIQDYEADQRIYSRLRSFPQVNTDLLKQVDLRDYRRSYTIPKAQGTSATPIVDTQVVQDVVARTEVVDQGVVVDVAGATINIHQDSNSICRRGGNSTCFRRQVGTDWLTIEPTAVATTDTSTSGQPSQTNGKPLVSKPSF